jgi:hypothetical protein
MDLVCEDTERRLLDLAAEAKLSPDALLKVLLDGAPMLPRGLGHTDWWAIHIRKSGVDLRGMVKAVQDGRLHPFTVSELYNMAVQEARDWWFPACSGQEIVSRHRDGREYLYCYQPLTSRHAYYSFSEDRFFLDPELSESQV